MKIIYRVTITEHERGWGVKVAETLDFSTAEEAWEYSSDFNSRNTATSAPNWYMQASDPYMVTVK